MLKQIGIVLALLLVSTLAARVNMTDEDITQLPMDLQLSDIHTQIYGIRSDIEDISKTLQQLPAVISEVRAKISAFENTLIKAQDNLKLLGYALLIGVFGLILLTSGIIMCLTYFVIRFSMHNIIRSLILPELLRELNKGTFSVDNPNLIKTQPEPKPTGLKYWIKWLFKGKM